MKTQTLLFNRALGILGAAIIMLSAAALGADPASYPVKLGTTGGANPVDKPMEQAAPATDGDTNSQPASLLSIVKKAAITGGMDPHGNSWESIKNSFQQFGRPEFVLRLFLSLTLAVACASAIAWHPRNARRRNLLSDIE